MSVRIVVIGTLLLALITITASNSSCLRCLYEQSEAVVAVDVQQYETPIFTTKDVLSRVYQASVVGSFKGSMKIHDSISFEVSSFHAEDSKDWPKEKDTCVLFLNKDMYRKSLWVPSDDLLGVQHTTIALVGALKALQSKQVGTAAKER